MFSQTSQPDGKRVQFAEGGNDLNKYHPACFAATYVIWKTIESVLCLKKERIVTPTGLTADTDGFMRKYRHIWLPPGAEDMKLRTIVAASCGSGGNIGWMKC